MATLERETEQTGSAWGDGWNELPGFDGEPSQPPDTVPLMPMSIPFLTLPREIRDMIYRHLLSAKYAKVITVEPAVDSLQDEYIYQFYPSILCTSRQIEREARHVLYTENLLVRINSSGPHLAAARFEYPGTTEAGRDVPILAAGDRAKQFRHHVMEVALLGEYAAPYDEFTDWSYNPDSRYSENCFVVTSNDLSRMCWLLMYYQNSRERPLSRFVLAMEISYDIDTRATHRVFTEEYGDTKDGAKSEYTSDYIAAEKDKVTVMEGVDADLISPRIRQLLEPFRSMHSLEAVHIEGPVGQHYKTVLVADMCRPEPSDYELFERILSTCEDAMTTYRAGHTSSAITKLKYSLDTIKGCKHLSPSPDPTTEPWNACRDLQFLIWSSLARASLQYRDNPTDLHDAWVYVDKLICEYVSEDWDFSNVPPMGHDIAMLFDLVAEVLDARNNFEADYQFGQAFGIQQVVFYLKQGLRHEPENLLLERRLRKTQEQLRIAEEVEDLMEISDRIMDGASMRQIGEDEAGFEEDCTGAGAGESIRDVDAAADNDLA